MMNELMNTKPLTVSVVIPTLNSPWLPQTIAGLRQQTYDLSLVEVLVVGREDAGRIETDALIKFIETDGPRPPAISRNIGLFAATGDIVCFIDDDCLPDPTWLEKLMAMYTSPHVEVVGGGMQFPTAAEGYWLRCDALASMYEYLEFRPAGLRKQLPSMNLSARRALLVNLGGFDEDYPFASGEDAELCMRLRREGHNLYFEPGAIVYHLGWRKTAKTVWGHIYRYGQFSPWITPSLSDVVSPPFFFRHWLLFLLVTPALMLWISARMFLRSPHLLRSWTLFPGLCIAQLAWCLGVIYQLRQRETESQPTTPAQEMDGVTPAPEQNGKPLSLTANVTYTNGINDTTHTNGFNGFNKTENNPVVNVLERAKNWWSKPDRMTNLRDFAFRHAPMLVHPTGRQQLRQAWGGGLTLQFDREVETIIDNIPPASVIVDVGSNIGNFSELFLNRGYTVVSVDPLPEAIEKQKAKFDAYIQRGKMYLHNVASSKEVGEAPLYISSDANGCFSSLEEHWSQEVYTDKWAGQMTKVEKIRLGDLVREYADQGQVPAGIKIDTEGHEYDVLLGLFADLPTDLFPKVIMFEFHTQPINHPVLHNSLNLLRSKGYDEFKYIIRYWDMILHESPWTNKSIYINQWDGVQAQGLVPAEYRGGNVIVRLKN